MEKEAALDLIEELDSVGEEDGEEQEDQELKRIKRLDDQEEEWLRSFVGMHPVFKEIPQRLKDEVIRRPATTSAGIPGANKRRRKLWKKKGLTLHLYSGEKSGFTLERALQEAGGDVRLLLEIDWKNGEEFDMLKDELYEKLLRLAMDGVLDCIVGGPNCRTRSMLRHIPKPGAPRPVRDWNEGMWGSERNTKEEDKKVFEDDVLMWRLWTLAMVAIHVRRTQEEERKEVKVLVEQPAEPQDFPEVVSFWRTREWKKLQEVYRFNEMTFFQGDWDGKSPTPTTVGGSLRLRSPRKKEKRLEDQRNQEPIRSSKDLERWAPGMMREVARAIYLQVQEGEEGKSVRKLSWDEHLRLGHVPFRRDCLICQQSRQKQNPHRRNRHPLSGVLSLDTAGPYRDGTDLVMTSRYLCVGAFTWAFPKGTRGFEEPKDPEVEGAPEVEEWKDRRKKEGEDEAPGGDGVPLFEDEEEEEGEESSPRPGPHRGEKGEESSPRSGPHKGEKGGPEEEEEQEWEVKVFRMAAPLATKKSEEVLGAIMEFILRLRADGFWVSQIHTDQGHEYYGTLKKWCLKRGIVVTRTPGDDPQGNGRAEVAIQGISQQVRASLLQAGVGWEWWPLAARHVGRIGEEPHFPNFLEEVLVRKRHWRRGVLLEPTCDKVKYLCPAWDHHGHWVLKEDNTKVVTRYFLKRLTTPVTEAVWLALEAELEDGLSARRRLREKTHPLIRKLEEEERGRSREGEKEMRISKVIEDEMNILVEEEGMTVIEEFKVIRKLRKMVQTPWEEEEVLQTKIVSPQEVSKNWSVWAEAAKSEIYSLLQEKEALEEITVEELEQRKRKAKEDGKKFEVIPSKVVFTKKPGPQGGKPKVRWVVCGNFEEKKEDEENFSSGADATAFRVLVWLAARRQWEGLTVDVKTAFLNAEWNEEAQDTLVVVKPPPILVENGALEAGRYYVPRKAVYGFRRSPRLWGNCRDEAMEAMDLTVRGTGDEEGEEKVMKLKHLDSGPNLWKCTPR